MVVREHAIEGVSISPLKIIPTPAGDVLHALKRSDNCFTRFGEAYLSIIYGQAVKAWKQHQEMTLNLVVPVGAIKFVIHDARQSSETRGEFLEVILSRDSYARLTISPGLWFGFQGLETGENLLLNVADVEHDPAETLTASLDAFDYQWN